MKTIDVVYYIQRNGILIPYDDANKIMSFVSNDYIYNETGLEVVHKIRRKNVVTFPLKIINVISCLFQDILKKNGLVRVLILVG